MNVKKTLERAEALFLFVLLPFGAKLAELIYEGHYFLAFLNVIMPAIIVYAVTSITTELVRRIKYKLFGSSLQRP